MEVSIAGVLGVARRKASGLQLTTRPTDSPPGRLHPLHHHETVSLMPQPDEEPSLMCLNLMKSRPSCLNLMKSRPLCLNLMKMCYEWNRVPHLHPSPFDYRHNIIQYSAVHSIACPLTAGLHPQLDQNTSSMPRDEEARCRAAYAKALLAEILPPLHCFHTGGIIHGDFKPENVVRCSISQTTKLIDFNCSEPIYQEGDARTRGLRRLLFLPGP